MSSQFRFSVYNFNIGRNSRMDLGSGPNYWVMVLEVDVGYE